MEAKGAEGASSTSTSDGFTGGENVATDLEVKGCKGRRKERKIGLTSRVVLSVNVVLYCPFGSAVLFPSAGFFLQESLLQALGVTGNVEYFSCCHVQGCVC